MGNGKMGVLGFSASFVLWLCAVRRAVCALSGAPAAGIFLSLVLLARRRSRHEIKCAQFLFLGAPVRGGGPRRVDGSPRER